MSENNYKMEFSKDSIFIEDENKMYVFRYNIGLISPYSTRHAGSVIWDYSCKSVKTDNPAGIFAMAPGKQSLSPVLTMMSSVHANQEFVNQFTIIKLEIDKTKILTLENTEMSFSECNIIATMGLDIFLLDEYPEYAELILMWQLLTLCPSDELKETFDKMHKTAHSEVLTFLQQKVNAT